MGALTIGIIMGWWDDGALVLHEGNTAIAAGKSGAEFHCDKVSSRQYGFKLASLQVVIDESHLTCTSHILIMW